MHIKILGTRGEIEQSRHRYAKHSGILIDGELLLDLGEKSYLKYHPKWILLTHLHPDHAYFMRRGHEEMPPTDAMLFAPESPYPNIKLVQKKIILGPYQITPIPVHHSIHVISHAYLIKKGKITILYTGDVAWIDKQYHSIFKKLDLVITEGSFIREGGMIRKDPITQKIYGHTGIPNLIRMFLPFTQHILFVHFGNWFYPNLKLSKQKILTLSKKYQIQLTTAYDGMTLFISR